MNDSQSVILRFLRCVADASYAFSRPSTVVPFAVLSLVQLVLLFTYVFFASPVFVWISPTVIATLGGSELLHYPRHLLALPEVVGWTRTVAWIVAGSALVRVGGRRVWGCLRERAGARGRETKRAGVPLGPFFVIALAYCGVLAGAHWLFTHAEGVRIVGRFQPVWNVADAVMGPLLTMWIACAWVALGDDPGALGGLRAGARILAGNAAPALLVSAVAALLASPFQFLTASVESYVRTATPGVSVFGAAAALVWDAPLRLFLFASALSLASGPGDGFQ